MRSSWIGLGFAVLVATTGLGCAKRLPLTPAECTAIVARARTVLADTYAVPPAALEPGATCATCGYPAPAALVDPGGHCATCVDERQ